MAEALSPNADTSAFKGNDYSIVHTQARDPNLIYTHNAMSPDPTYAKNDVNPNPMYLQSTMEPNASPGPKSNKSNDSQTSVDAHDEASFRPADNINNDCLQPYSVTRCQKEYEVSIKMPENTEDNPHTQPYAVTYQKHDGIDIESANCDVGQPYAVQYEDETVGDSANNDGNPCIQRNAVNHQEDEEPFLGPLNCNGGQPYAVKYHEDDDSGNAASKNRYTVSIASEDEVIQPYAAAYMCQGDVGWNTTSRYPHTSLFSQNQNQPTAASNNINDVSTSPSSNGDLHALDPNPMYAAADMVRGDVGWNTASRDTHASLSSQNLPATALNSINDANDVLHALNPNLMYAPNVQRLATHGGDVKPEKITFGGQREEPGNIGGALGFGVAVSADNEIFVTDHANKRIQVFSMNGTYLRLFPTVVPGKNMAMFPYSVTLDVVPGYLWVLGRGHYEQWRSYTCYEGHVVQYSKNGHPIKKFDVSLRHASYHVIAMDVRNNKVIVGDGSRITMFDRNGSRFWSSKLRTGYGIGGVISDKEGNILLTDGDRTVKKYNQSGVKVFEFGRYGKAKGQLHSPKGICLDSSGHIIVANTENHRVDMFTRQGDFVRTIADIKGPWDVAMGPFGELVVISSYTYTVTIIPRHMVRP
ncbi:PREDICTED: uncharacterized protein LOC109470158 [Branchiostoma belcheri]|uniref:Uncharacterized protein LOC109470158 n=1 Tax=Branchiostoma belcheri TaxID=7741 RepID=A0A6P4YS09_BRABE|nr:PREDICTED: uncharacterized protein LOC109470158 [Branchiostoma belcheri]